MPRRTKSEDLVPLDEVAERLGMSYSAAVRLARANGLPGQIQRVGRRHRISRVLFEQYLTSPVNGDGDGDGETAA